MVAKAPDARAYAFVACVLVFFVYVLDPSAYTTISLLLAILALLIGLLTISRIGVKLHDRGSIYWSGVLMGVGLFLVSNAIWSIYPSLAAIASPADAFAITGYLAILATSLYYFLPFREALSKNTLFTTAVVVILLLTVIGLGFEIVKPTGLSEILYFVYPVLDVLLLMMAIPILELVSKGTFWKPILCLFLGLIFLLVADLGSAWANFTSGPVTFLDSLWNMLYSWGYIAVTLAFYLRREQFSRALP